MASAQHDRFALAMQHFGNALERLHEALALPEDRIVRDALIQRFEFTYEAGWKAAYRWLRARGHDIDEEAPTVIPKAFSLRLIEDEKGWGAMRRYRNKTSHTYDERIAVEVAAFVRGDGVRLLDALRAVLRERQP